MPGYQNQQAGCDICLGTILYQQNTGAGFEVETALLVSTGGVTLKCPAPVVSRSPVRTAGEGQSDLQTNCGGIGADVCGPSLGARY